MSNTFLVPEGTEAILIRADAPWGWKNYRLIETKQANTFLESEVIINPVTLECRHTAQYAQRFSASYARSGYYGFRRGDYCLLVPGENVSVSRIEPPANLQDRQQSHAASCAA